MAKANVETYYLQLGNGGTITIIATEAAAQRKARVMSDNLGGARVVLKDKDGRVLLTVGGK
jgi:hypothetical protein